ncbi:MAG: energy-coupling factor ABC transporter permease [Amaricoccus sp.]
MHMEPGIVTGAKLVLGYATAAGSLGYGALLLRDTLRQGGLAVTAARCATTTALVFSFFQVLPHYPIGISEVHLILGSTLYLLFGTGPAAFGLAAGLLLQGLFFAPFDLPQYGMNVTTLLVPLFAVAAVARRVIPTETPYVDLGYWQVFRLSLAYQGGVAAWVAFWAIYGRGFGAENLVAVGTFFASYILVVAIEPLIDLAVLGAAKAGRSVTASGFFQRRLHHAA